MKFALLLALLVVLPARASDWIEREDIARLFAEAGVRGSFVAFDSTRGTLQGHGQERAGRRFVPASTFKVANALIGLASGAVADVDEILPFGGQPQRFEVWEQDMSLRQGMPVSNLPVFQALARRIGLDSMGAHLRLFGYGNAELAASADDFWLVGPLTISAIEQTRFLAALARRQLPVSVAAQAAVAEIMHIEDGVGWSLHAKTGWADHYRPHLGWWVGWVEREGRIHAFALNIDMPDGSFARTRIDLGRAALSTLGLIDAAPHAP